MDFTNIADVARFGAGASAPRSRRPAAEAPGTSARRVLVTGSCPPGGRSWAAEAPRRLGAACSDGATCESGLCDGTMCVAPAEDGAEPVKKKGLMGPIMIGLVLALLLGGGAAYGVMSGLVPLGDEEVAEGEEGKGAAFHVELPVAQLGRKKSGSGS